jgi:hypothetical protein
MNINLKQVEIVEALKQFVTKKGISLVGKKVDISFTAGRKDTGVSADIVIEDSAEIPGFTDSSDEAEVNKPVLSVVKTETPVEPPPAEEVAETPAAEAKVPTTSLFG